jgi:hypothetical protein
MLRPCGGPSTTALPAGSQEYADAGYSAVASSAVEKAKELIESRRRPVAR